MAEQRTDTLSCDPQELRQAMSLHTRKITDSCRDKDCIEDLRVYLTTDSQAVLNDAASTRVRSAELLYTYIDVERVAFDRNHYCINVTFYYRVLADAVVGVARPVALYGLAVFSKRAVLCGEDSRARIFRSDTEIGPSSDLGLLGANLPVAVVESLDPMILSSKVTEASETDTETVVQIPQAIQNQFDQALVLDGEGRRLYVTLGQFSIISLERDAQLVVPVLDYAVPCKECSDTPGSGEDPCEMFNRIPFPAGEFSPTGCSEATQGT